MTSKCACVSEDRFSCMAIRYSQPRDVPDPESCECACHDELTEPAWCGWCGGTCKCEE